ncbi:tetratricopeptide repeat protein [Edaphobacter bradus]|uniref:tetratricopeptide repeat protein n=1 Tax=Edaphobacter bradus TaxID=2259016 RepID=UPI0021DFAF8B|nr:tetratricopeptide repeat protein [Edaphobacter bradus]
MIRLFRSSLPYIFFGILLLCAPLCAQKPLSHEEARALDHENPTWGLVVHHLPDPTTATAAQLETASDVLRARRFLEDALDYLGYAMQRGGNQTRLLNKMGITELELRRPEQARLYFQRVVKINKKDSEGWNNLGAIEYLEGRYNYAISNYKRAIKLDKNAASYHSNLATAYFDKKDFNSGRKEYEIALKIDPGMLQHHGTAGTTTRMLSPEDHARFCYELARLYAGLGDEQNMLHYLTMSSESGFDVLHEMGSDGVMGKYRKDPRVLLLVKNATDLRSRTSLADAAPLPPLAPDKK